MSVQARSSRSGIDDPQRPASILRRCFRPPIVTTDMSMSTAMENIGSLAW
jgi:hypothetical protein